MNEAEFHGRRKQILDSATGTTDPTNDPIATIPVLSKRTSAPLAPVTNAASVPAPPAHKFKCTCNEGMGFLCSKPCLFVAAWQGRATIECGRCHRYYHADCVGSAKMEQGKNRKWYCEYVSAPLAPI